MPFDEENDAQPSEHAQKVGLKQVSTQKSIFDGKPKKPTQEDLDNKVKHIQEKMSNHKSKAAELALMFNKSMSDKTLRQNKTIFSQEIEKDLLSKMVQLAIDINSDPGERFDGMGSLSWITLLLKTCFLQRDKINSLEYDLSMIDKKIEMAVANQLRLLDSKK